MKTIKALAATAGFILAASTAGAMESYPRSIEFQNNASVGGSGEIETNLPALPGGAGGEVVYDKLLTLKADNVLFGFVIRFTAQADVHNGSALLMNATVNGNLVEPLAGQTASGGGGPFLQTGWWTLLHPSTGVPNTCNDGGGGTADCHDNTIAFTGCYRIKPDDPRTQARVTIKLANLPGNGDNLAFYERSFIEIDGVHKNGNGDGPNFCNGVGTELH